jgi:type IV pilus assembly protein PilW
MIELMVGVVIGLIGIVIISQMYLVSEDRKRSATGASDTQVAGNLAIFSIERAARMAGYGLSNSLLLNCTTLAYNSARSTPSFSFVIRPAWIEDGTTGAVDQITFMSSGGSGVATLDGNVFNGTSASGAAFPMQSVAGFVVGGLVIAAESAKNCTLAEVTQIPAGTNTLSQTGGTYNNPAGSGVAYTGSAYLFNVGFKAYDGGNPQRTPFSIQRFRVVNEALRAETLIPYSTATDSDADGFADYVIANGVVQMQALYGLDDGNGTATVAPNRYLVTNAVYAADDGIVDNFVTATPASAAAWRQMKVIRVAFLIRIGKWEKDQVTTTEPTWNDGLSSFTMTNALDGTDWRNYRYRVYEVDIPMRNMLWTPS